MLWLYFSSFTGFVALVLVVFRCPFPVTSAIPSFQSRLVLLSRTSLFWGGCWYVFQVVTSGIARISLNGLSSCEITRYSSAQSIRCTFTSKIDASRKLISIGNYNATFSTIYCPTYNDTGEWVPRWLFLDNIIFPYIRQDVVGILLRSGGGAANNIRFALPNSS